MVALWLTATNIRYLFNIRGIAEEPFDGHAASELTLDEPIVRGVLSTPKYVMSVYQHQKDLVCYMLPVRSNNLRTLGR